MSNAMKQQSDTSATGLNKILRGDLVRGKESSAWGILLGSDTFNATSDATLFSCSLPILQPEKLNLNISHNGHTSVDDASKDLDKLRLELNGDNVLDDVETRLVGNLLPDDEDELLAGVMDVFDLSRLPGTIEDFDEYNVFGSGGGMEPEHDPLDRLSMGISKVCLANGVIGNGTHQYGLPNGVGTATGEHPYGEHPSRTLFVRNINSNVEDSELRTLFEQYGDIRTMYTACKHRGFVMISYYDIRAARTAMRALQNKPLRRRKLDIHFSIPKDNPSDKDINQGTLVVFNLDPSVSNEDLRLIFGAYGEIKEIRQTPHKRLHKFIEFYDVRAAEAALKSLNRSDIAGKRIKLEPSRPSGAHRNLMLQLNQELDPDESRSFSHPIGSPGANSPPANWAEFNSPMEHSSLQSLSRSPIFKTLSPTTSSQSPGLASILHAQVTNPSKVAPVGKDQRWTSALEHTWPNQSLAHRTALPLSHSLPESKLSQFHGNMPSVSQSSSNGSFMETLSGPRFLWGSSKTCSEHSTSSAWPTSSVAHPFSTNGKAHGFSYTGQRYPLLGSSQHHQVHHHVGSALHVAPLEKHFGFFPESPETSFLSPLSFGGVGMDHTNRVLMTNMGSHGPLNAGMTVQRNISENGSLSCGIMSSLRLNPIFLSNSPYSGLTPNSVEGFVEHGCSRWVVNNGNPVDSKKQFQLDIDKIISGEDTRTTLMIKNIPNKYTSKMLLAAIDERHRGAYDFLYLPIDFKNKCNVGYAFINMLSPSLIIPFYKAFNGKKWEKFNSEKVASLAYARIQGKEALVCHFQNSSLMNEDKRCHPIVFHSDGHEANEEESLPSNIQFHQIDESDARDSLGNQTNHGSIKSATA